MAKNVEKEFKWALPLRQSFDGFVAALREESDRVVAGKRLRIVDYYLDDGRGTLAARKIALRIRRVGASWEATLKSRSALKNGLATRREWTRSFTEVRTFTAAWLALKLWKNWRGVELANVGLYFTIQNHRQLYQVRYGRCICEAALDDYKTLAGGREWRRREIELELKKGSAKDFIKLIEKVTARSGLKAAKLSKVAGAEKWILQNFRKD